MTGPAPWPRGRDDEGAGSGAAGGPRPDAVGRLRRAGPRDLDGLAAIWSLTIAHHAPFDPVFTQRTDSEAELRKLLRAMLRDRDAAVLVWEGESGIAGMCIVRVDHAPPVLEETERAEITDVGVREEWRRRGIGRALVGAALAWARARGLPRAEVRVAHANREAQAFWRALGFGDLMDILQRRL